jgi:uncharacterized protein
VSRENVEIVRRAWEANLRRDNDSALSLYDPEVEIESPFFDASGVYRGVDGVREFFRLMLGPLSDWTSTVEEWIDAGDDVIAVIRVSGRGRKSGVPVEAVAAHVWSVRNGKLVRLHIYATREEALKAVGLKE